MAIRLKEHTNWRLRTALDRASRPVDQDPTRSLVGQPAGLNLFTLRQCRFLAFLKGRGACGPPGCQGQARLTIGVRVVFKSRKLPISRLQQPEESRKPRGLQRATNRKTLGFCDTSISLNQPVRLQTTADEWSRRTRPNSVDVSPPPAVPARGLFRGGTRRLTYQAGRHNAVPSCIARSRPLSAPR